jgi:ornithine cyclodeaminase
MHFLSEETISALAPPWSAVVAVLRQTAATVTAADFAQPVKPYLRYRDPSNRIIAMPAFVGGAVNMAGLKWIASFPGNLAKDLPRAHALTILNDAATGRPVAVLDSSSLSAIRTAGVSAIMIEEFLRRRPDLGGLKVGITGFGPIGVRHLEMLRGLFSDRLDEVVVCETNPARWNKHEGLPTRFCLDWREAYQQAHVFMTCTTSRERYIDLAPAPGTLHLNVSLRDYQPRVGRAFDRIVVDDWDEVCRENTDIEVMQAETGLAREQTTDLFAVCARDALAGLRPTDSVMFNPMGMAVFDVAVATLYYRAALVQGTALALTPAGPDVASPRNEQEGARC